jgi:TRAP-type C4-dicarboxylate transport system permease small subunit
MGLQRIQQAAQKAARGLAGTLFLLLFAVFLIQIVARLVFDHPLPWSDEAAVVLYVWVILWAAAAVVPQREQVMFDLAWNLAGPRLRRAMRIVGNVLVGGLSLAALPATWDYVHFMARESTPVLEIPFMWVFLPFVVLVAALALRCALDLLRALGVLRDVEAQP